jgi:hypothetical protein
MLKRTGRWLNRRRLWYYEESPEKKTADRPHPIAIRLAFISPLLAVVATVISLMSFYTSRESLEVGQRAYVSFSKGSMSVSQISYGPEDYEKDGVRIAVWSDFRNLGNTPARFENISIELALPKGWSTISSHYQPNEPFGARADGKRVFVDTVDHEYLPPELETKESYHWGYSAIIAISPTAYSHLKNFLMMTAPTLPALRPEVYIDVLYKDVFLIPHHIRVRWESDLRSDHPHDITLR